MTATKGTHMNKVNPSEIDTQLLSLLRDLNRAESDKAHWSRCLARRQETTVQQWHDEAAVKVAAIRAKIAPLDDLYAQHNWSRFFIVTSSSGHIHRTMHCHSCNKGRNFTSFALMPSLSGSSTDAAVARLGSALCSHCFPEAPTDQCEQTKINQRAAQVLLDTGDESEFDAVLAKSAAQSAMMCAGSNKSGIAANSSGWQKCQHCDNTSRTMSFSGKSISKMPRHKPVSLKAGA
jgi:hypothetical protein